MGQDVEEKPYFRGCSDRYDIIQEGGLGGEVLKEVNLSDKGRGGPIFNLKTMRVYKIPLLFILYWQVINI